MIVTTPRPHDEVWDFAPLFETVPSKNPDPRVIEIPKKIIDQQAGPSNPSAFKHVPRALIRYKKQGRETKVTAPPPRAENVIDLMEALRRGREANGNGEPARAGINKREGKSKGKPGDAAAGAQPDRRAVNESLTDPTFLSPAPLQAPKSRPAPGFSYVRRSPLARP
jgi:DNA end-binding protein Ku